LRDEGQRWHRLAVDGTLDVRAVFSWSYRALSVPAARLFRLLALHPGAEASAAAAASLAGSTTAATLPLLRELVSGNLLQELPDELGPGRYGTHDLLRAYGADLAARTDAEPDRRAALQRVLDHYLHTINDTHRRISPRQPPALPAPPPDVTLQPHTGSTKALAWLEAERDNLIAVVHFAARAEFEEGAGFEEYAWQLAWFLAPALANRGFRAECLAVAQLGHEAACRLADPVAELQIGRVLGAALMYVGQLEESEQLLRGLLARCDERGERILEARVRADLAILSEMRGDLHGALAHLEQVLPLLREGGDLRELAECVNGMAYYRAQLGDAEGAVQLGQESLALFERAGSRLWAMYAWDTLGFALHQLGRLEEATEHLLTALALAREAGSLRQEVTVLLHLGDCHHTAGRPELAEECWTQALQLAGERDDLEVDQLRQRLAPASAETGAPGG
jgi:tetratricopeptide (TPR) repeat protein